jgi:hypothetical protein
VRTKEILAQHFKSVSGDFNIVLLEMVSKELPHYLAAFAARMAGTVITAS